MLSVGIATQVFLLWSRLVPNLRVHFHTEEDQTQLYAGSYIKIDIFLLFAFTICFLSWLCNVLIVLTLYPFTFNLVYKIIFFLIAILFNKKSYPEQSHYTEMHFILFSILNCQKHLQLN